MSEAPSGKAAQQHRGVVDVVVYAVARLLLFVVLTAAIYGVARLLGLPEFPIVVAALFGLIIAMPLGIWVLRPLRLRATAALAEAGERRRRERDQLRARLRGETGQPGETPEKAPDS
ncbi:membrane protein [Mycobacterium kubicae]|uniref:DUF4229 domain-containing protein n=1 Tax=Mycobacterium kubicae TaxID=120959 RepID=A0AAX1JE85_9MYCO|nr:DUF4229 domain-containing protein [Mycobacterium kubicae]MCV7094972.1 DUF4229 domain-containing protein [Mycobacterium kubicae]OBF24290.1 hypothetical protein A5725_06650 [Mycobacterium kubicae]ORV97004.1 hypothetical protein AWC13_17125 [Mycobacterium kubicae]QNI10575.1 DUF4229 domain-containing protein [Mycobacterium kubicae]QPI38786.1 DUF4229 domain-containing protein [Mycobacterium kubicae]